jgi:ABC-type enterochelin transport system permease subunit
MQSEGVVITIISTIITAVVATTIVVAAVAVGSPLLGLLVPNVEVIIFDGIARCKSSGRDTPSSTDSGGPLDG